MIREGSGVKGTFGREVKGSIVSFLHFHFFKLQKWFILIRHRDGGDVSKVQSFMNPQFMMRHNIEMETWVWFSVTQNGVCHQYEEGEIRDECTEKDRSRYGSRNRNREMYHNSSFARGIFGDSGWTSCGAFRDDCEGGRAVWLAITGCTY